MNRNLMFRAIRLLGTVLFFGSTIVLVGCTKKTDAGAELEKTIKELEQTKPALQAPAQLQSSAQANQPAAGQLSLALIALKERKYTEVITQMELARSNPGKTPQQTIAIQDAMAAVMQDLYTRAANGDAAAKQAIEKHNVDRNRH